MDLIDALAKRHMVRAFTPKPVDEVAIVQLLHAAMRGPSAGNTASLQVLVLAEEQCQLYWETTLTPQRRTSFPWPKLLLAPLLLIPTVDPHDYVARYSEPDKVHTALGQSANQWPVPYWWVDGGAAVENVLLMATSLGLGACFFGQFEHETALSRRFGIPDGRRALGTIAVGHPDGEAERPSHSSQRLTATVDERTHWGTW